MNTVLKQAQREVCRLKKNDSFYGKTTICFYIDFSRHPEETERITGYQMYLQALSENNGDIANALEVCGMSKDSIVTEAIEEEPVLLCSTRITKTQEKVLLKRFSDGGIYNE